MHGVGLLQERDVSAALAAMLGVQAAAVAAPQRNSSLPRDEARPSGSLEPLRPVPRSSARVEVPLREATELSHGQADGSDGVAGQQDLQEPAAWASRVSLLLLCLRAVGFARPSNK